MDTFVVVGLLALTLAGSAAPKASSTLSSSSSRSSIVAVKTTALEISPAAKVTLSGTE